MTQEIIKLYQEGMSISAIDKQIPNYNYRQIRKIITDVGIEIRGGRKKKQLTEEQLDYLKQKYCEESEDLCVLAKHFGWDKETLRNLIEEKGWKKKNNNRINKRIVSNYFSQIDAPEKAYFLGLLFTDGTVDKPKNRKGRIRLQLQAQDKNILERLRKVLQIDSELILDPRGNQCYSLEFLDDQIFEDLGKYNIIPNKTYEVLHLPTNIPNQYKRDFIRGLLDGDGGITFDEKMSKDVSIHFTSYHPTIVEEFQCLIDGLIDKTEHNKIFFTNAWHCTWRGYDQVVKILDILYKDSEYYIERKYNRYQQLLERN